MGKGGPRPKPTALRILEGNPGHKKMSGNEPKPDPAIPTCPSWLPATAKAEWLRVSRELYAMAFLVVPIEVPWPDTARPTAIGTSPSA